MKIKRKILAKGILVSLLSLIVVACSDKINEQDGQLNADDLDYTDSEAMIDPLIGAYNNFGSRGWEEPLLLSVRGDDVNSGGYGDQQQFEYTDNYTYTVDYWMYNSLWQIHYGDIIKLNTAIDLIETYKSFADASYYDDADQYLSEIKVMRAWLHFNLARTWGDVFIIETTQPDTEYVNGVASKADVMQYIIDQMNEAIPNLPAIRPNERTGKEGRKGYRYR